jgi:hypothetical protein
MGYAVCVSDAGRWVWDFWVETPPETPQVIYKAVCVDFKSSSSHWSAQQMFPTSTGGHEQCPLNMQGLDFVSKDTEISVGRFLIEYYTPLTLGEQHQGALSNEDVVEVWLAVKSEAISKVRRTKGGAKGAEAHCPDVKEVEKTFWLSRPDDWVINKKTKGIIMFSSNAPRTLQRHITPTCSQ